jgi:hypothetical protein
MVATVEFPTLLALIFNRWLHARGSRTTVATHTTAGPYLPAPHTVNSPRTKSTGSACVGMGNGRHRSWLGVTTPRLKLAVRPSVGKSSGWNGSCVTEGRMRYSQLRCCCLHGGGCQGNSVCEQVSRSTGQIDRNCGQRFWSTSMVNRVNMLWGVPHLRGTVKAVPDNCSAYRPYGQACIA